MYENVELLNTIAYCPRCGSENLLELVGNCGPHHGKLVCGDCDRWIRWLPKPKIDEHQKRVDVIDDLLEIGLTTWERGFLTNIRDRRYLTPAQAECFEKIREKYCGIDIEEILEEFKTRQKLRAGAG